MRIGGVTTNLAKCQSMWQWRNHGPGLSVKKRIVTLSPAGVPDARDVPNDGIVEVVGGIASATEHVEGVSVQVNGMLYNQYSSSGDIRRHTSA